MSDAADDRHQRHEGLFDVHEQRIGDLEEESLRCRIWRTGNGTPNRGAEARIHHLEEGAVMHDQIDQLIDKIVRAHQKTVSAQVKTFGPYVLLLVGLVYWAITGHPPGQVTL